ncbi:MAG: S9 family peptidase [Chthoniobacterales bacterium]|nr:S9 family peptidase [Chthoniobacterales bacterium]
MRTSHHFCLGSALFLLAFGAILDAPVSAAEKRSITEKDLFDFVWIGDPQVSPDGSRTVFVRVSVNEKKDGYDTSLWVVPTAGGEEPHRLTSGTRDAAPRWSPDGRYLAFARAAEKEGKPDPPQLCMLPMSGGDAFQFTSLPKGASGIVWSPDGKTIAFLSSTNPEDLAKQERKKRKEEELKAAAVVDRGVKESATPAASPIGKAAGDDERESDAHVITRAVYRSNNEGYLDPKRPQHIWTIPAPRSAEEKVQPKQLTSGRFNEDEPNWSKDGAQIHFISSRVDEPYYELPKTELYSVAASGGEPVKITTVNMEMSDLALSPDGKQLAFVGSKNEPVSSYMQPDLWVMDLTPNAQPRNLTAGFDWDLAAGVFGDNGAPRAGGGNLPIWSGDGKSILEIFSKEGRTNLGRFDVASGAFTELTKGDQAVVRFRASADGAKLVYQVSTSTRIGDLAVLEERGQPRQLTDVNRELFSQLNLTEPEEVWYESFDGKRVQAWLQKPPRFDAKKKYPLVLNIHGGPHAAYGFVFDHEFQWMAAKGYVVLYPNPRGSTSYGQEFGNVIQYRYPGDDYQDLMLGVDDAIKRGYIDEKKLAVTGGSGGGLLTNWVVTHTDRFAAGVAQRDIADWESWWYTADFTLFQPTWFKAPPFQDPEDFKARSPITYINNVKTPMMFVLGETDTRTPTTAGGEAMFRALKFRRIPTVMVKFPNETHELSRSGQPWHRIERLQHIVGWFDKWLLGVAKPEYEIAPELSPEKDAVPGKPKPPTETKPR